MARSKERMWELCVGLLRSRYYCADFELCGLKFCWSESNMQCHSTVVFYVSPFLLFVNKYRCCEQRNELLLQYIRLRHQENRRGSIIDFQTRNWFSLHTGSEYKLCCGTVLVGVKKFKLVLSVSLRLGWCNEVWNTVTTFAYAVTSNHYLKVMLYECNIS
jgi:hypothetical protein